MTRSRDARRRRLVLAGVAAGLWRLAPAAAHADSHATGAAGRFYERSVGRYVVPDVVLRDTDARPVPLRTLLAANDAVMLNFVFTTCSTICPVMVKVFSDLPPRLGGDAGRVRLVSISIDPENDTPERLRGYAKQFGAPGIDWRFLTGPVDDIRKVMVAFDSWRGDKMKHEPLTLIRPQGSTAWVRIDGFASADELVQEYRKAAAL